MSGTGGHFHGMDPEYKKDKVLQVALKDGAAWGSVYLGLGIAAVVAATKYSTKFNTRLGISGKVALAISPGLGAFFFNTERTITEANRDPHAFGIYGPGQVPDIAAEGAHKLRGTLPHGGAHMRPWHHAANYLYENPFQMIAALGIPTVGYIFWGQKTGRHADLKLSQKIMTSRLYGQSAVLAILLGTMAFHDVMRRRGGFFTEEDLAREEAQKEQSK